MRNHSSMSFKIKTGEIYKVTLRTQVSVREVQLSRQGLLQSTKVWEMVGSLLKIN